MSAASPLQETSRGRLFDFPAERVIALGRIVLLSFALVAVILEASLTATSVPASAAMLAIYLVIAVLQGTLALRRLPSRTQQIFSHLFDIAAAATLVALTEGLVSPFIVFFFFILLASTVRWNWRGALVTAVLV